MCVEFVWHPSLPHAWAELSRVYDLRAVIVNLTVHDPLLVRPLEDVSIVGLLHTIEDIGPSWAKKVVADSSARNVNTRAVIKAILAAEAIT